MGLGEGEEEDDHFPGGMRAGSTWGARGRWQSSDREQGRFEQPGRTQLQFGSRSQHCCLHSPAPEANASWPFAWLDFGSPVCSITMGYGAKNVYFVQIMPILAENQSKIKAFQEILLGFAYERCKGSSSALSG